MKKFLFSLSLALVSLASLAQVPTRPNVRLPGDFKRDSVSSLPRKDEYRLFFNAQNQPRVLDYLGNTTGLRDLLGVITGGAGVSGITQSAADGRYLLNTYVPTWSTITGKPTLFSGNYNDLLNKPTIPALPAWLPSSDPGYVTLTTGDGRYRLASVAIDYTALINRPTIPVVPAWLPTSDPGYLLNTYVPTWSSITGKPAFFSGSYPDLINKPTLSTVAGTGSYTDLLNKPVIPAATVITNNLTTTTTGTALDAAQGKTLKDAVDTNTSLISGKLNVSDSTLFVRKLSGNRLIAPGEITKLANTSGTNTGDETAAGIKSKLGITTLSGSNTGDQTVSISGNRITLSGGGGFVDVPSSGGSATPLANNLTTTTTGSALDAVQGKVIADSLLAQRNRIASNATTITGKLAINDTSSLVRKLSGNRLIAPGEITKLANTSGTNSGDETAAGIKSKLGITTLSGSNTGDQIPANNLTTTTAGTGLDAVQGKRLNDSLTVQRADINTNKTAAATAQSAANAAQTTANAKQNTITTSTNLAAASVTVNTLTDSDSTGRVPNTDWVRRYVLRTMPRSFAYEPTQFDTTKSSLTILPSYIRGLFSGSGYNPATGVISGGGTSGPWSTSGTVTYYNPGSVGIGTNIPKKLFDVNGNALFTAINIRGQDDAETNANLIENAPGAGIRIRGGYIHSFNTIRHEGNGNFITDGNYFLRALGRNDRAIFINPGGITIGNGTTDATATLDVTGTAKVSGAAQIGGQLTATGGIKFADNTTLTTAPAAVPILYLTDPASFATSAAGYTYIQYDGSVWVRSSGTVDSNTDNNPKYTALQYNAGSDHFDRQYTGYAMFGWWRNSSANRWQQLKYAINHTVGAKIQVEDGTYDFTENAFSPGNFELRGNLVDPSRVVFRAVSSQTMIINGWFWYDGVTDGQRFDNILIHGIRFVQASTATVNSSRGPIVFEGASQNNITVRRCEYLQQSTTAITNFFFTKSGANLKTQNITFEDNRSVNPTTKGRMMYEAINQDHPNNDKGVGTNIKIRRNYISGFNYGFSVAGNYDNTLIDDNDIGNCDNYGSEFAGSNTNATLSNNRFFGTHNVLWASNYIGETGASGGDYAITAGSGQHYINNHTVGKVTGGYVEIRGGGVVEFVGNDLRMDGGILFLQTDKGGVVGGIMQRNQIISSMTNTNWRNQTTNLVFFNGANNVKVSSNYFERGGTDATAVIQVNSNGLTNTGNLFFQNIMQTGANGTYFGATSTSTIRVGNINTAGTAVN